MAETRTRNKGTTVSKVESEKKSDKKKDFIIRQLDGTSLYSIAFEDGGQVPQMLSGLYTSETAAGYAIKQYEAVRR